MAKLNEIRIKEHFIDADVKVDFRVAVNVTKEGVFGARLPKDVLLQMQECGMKMEEIGKGYFTSKTYDGVEKAIRQAVRNAYTAELVEDKNVINYSIETFCHYCKDSRGDIHPNGAGVDSFEWCQGTYDDNQYHPYSLSVYVGIKRKKTFRFGNGMLKTRYDNPVESSIPKNSNIEYIQRLCRMGSEVGWAHTMKVHELECNEENAAFFVSFIKAIINMNEKLLMLQDPKDLQTFIQNNRQPLLS